MLAGMAAAKDITVGFRHERLTVIDINFRRTPSGAYFKVRCDCGTEKEVLFRGYFQAKSCGCAQRDAGRAALTKHGDAVNGRKVRLYCIWQSMRDRCENPLNDGYH